MQRAEAIRKNTALSSHRGNHTGNLPNLRISYRASSGRAITPYHNTWKSKYRELTDLIQRYDAFLNQNLDDYGKPLSFDSRMKLINEISRIHGQLKHIRTMNMDELESDCLDSEIAITARL